MNGKNINYSIAGYSVIEEVASGVISGLSVFIEKIQQEREQIRIRSARKRAMQKQLHQDAIDNLPLELKFRLGVPRK